VALSQATPYLTPSHCEPKMFPNPPDPSLRQPLTLSVVLPVYTGHYAMAVLAMLPNTFILRLSLLPFIIWQAWTCAVGFDSSLSIAQWLGYQSADRLIFWNFPFVVRFPPIVISYDTDLMKINHSLQCFLCHSGRSNGHSSRDR
jgi:hypothetical protein